MRRIFTSLPYFLPPEPEAFQRFFIEHGTVREVDKGQSLKLGGEEARLFYLTSGLCAYYAGDGLGRQPTILSFILPRRSMGDLTAAIGNRCNVHTVALEKSTVLVLAPQLLQETIQAHPELTPVMMQNIIAKEEALLEGMVANFTRAPDERLAVLVKSLIVMEKIEPDAEGWLVFPLRLSAERLGEALHLNRVSVARILSQWKKAGLTKRKDGYLHFSRELFTGLDDWLERHPSTHK